MIRESVFKHNLNEIIGRTFSKKQLDFFDYALNTINNDKEKDKLTVFAARCGIGKSTFLKVLIKSWLAENTNEGLIIVTDSLQRLNELNDENDYRIAYITNENKATEIIRQAYCPILLISTQRYFLMDSIEEFLTYKENGIEKKRTTVIFDEAPYFYRDGKIGIDELNTLHSALNEGISDLYQSDKKQWLIEQYNQFREKMIETINGLEQKRNKTTYLFYKPEIQSISENDTEFLEIVSANEDIFRKYPEAKTTINDIIYFIQHGGFFTSFKLTDNNNYQKHFIIRRSFKDKFLFERVKTFVFDATASVSENYCENGEWMKILNCEEFNTSLDYLNIHLIDINTSRNALFNKANRNDVLSLIKEYINENINDFSDTQFISYKQFIDKNTFDSIGFNQSNSLYFGNTKGFNRCRDKHTLIQVGLNRQSDINYVLNLISNDDCYAHWVESQPTIEKNIAFMDELLKSDLVNSYMAAEVAADFIQNLFRIKCRDFNNKDRVDVYLFTRATENFMAELNYHLGRFGAHIKVIKLEEMQALKIMNRKGETKTKKVLEWLQNQEKGTTFDSRDMLSFLGLTSDDLKMVKKSSKYLKKAFNEMKIPGTRSKYMVV